jgi:hypothetical protein
MSARSIAFFGPARRAALALGAPSGPGTALAVGIPQQTDQHRPECPILLAVDQELGEGARVISLGCTRTMPEGTAVQTPAPFQPCSRYPAGDPWERSCYPAEDPRERSCYPTPCGTHSRHAWAAGDPNREPRRAAARHRSVDGRDDHDPLTYRGSAPVDRRARPCPTRGHRPVMSSLESQRRPDAAAPAARLAQERGSAPDVRACAVRSSSPEGSWKRSTRRRPPW